MLQSEIAIYINIYAPNDRTEREAFFQRLQSIPIEGQRKIVLLGDFNCVCNPSMDRVNYNIKRSMQAESPALLALLDTWHLIDSFSVIHSIGETQLQLQEFQYSHMTFRRGYSQSRLDRIYCSIDLTDWVTSHETSSPGNLSDHRQVSIAYRNPEP